MMLSPRSGGAGGTPVKTTKTARVVPQKERAKIEKDFRDVLVRTVVFERRGGGAPMPPRDRKRGKKKCVLRVSR